MNCVSRGRGTLGPQLIIGPFSPRQGTTYLAERATTSGMAPTLLLHMRLESEDGRPIESNT